MSAGGPNRLDPGPEPLRGVTPSQAAGGGRRRWQALGQVLVTRGLLSQEQLSMAFERQRGSRQRLGRLLIELNMITEAALLECLAAQFDKPLMSRM